MTENDEKLLAEFEVRMRQLIYLCDVLKEENISLKEQLAQKGVLVEELTLEVDELKAKYDNLKFAKSFSLENNEGMEQAKRRISKLVREVDRCIAMLRN